MESDLIPKDTVLSSPSDTSTAKVILKNNRDFKKWFFLGFILVMLVIFSGVSYKLYYGDKKASDIQQVLTNFPSPTSIPLKVYQDEYYNYAFSYPQEFFTTPISSESAIIVKYCPQQQSPCAPLGDIFSVSIIPNLDTIPLETWIMTAQESPIKNKNTLNCFLNDPRTIQDAGEIQEYSFRSYSFTIDAESKNNYCQKETLAEGRYKYTIIEKGNAIVLIAIEQASEKSYHELEKLSSTFRFITPTVSNEESTWDPVCEKLRINTFDISVSPGDGITHIARKAVTQYFNSVTLSGLNNTVPRLNAEEYIYVEDYVRKKLTGESLIQKSIAVPCMLAEEATLKARLLTIQQKENLQQYSNKVPEHEIQETINEELEKLFEKNPDLKKHSGSLKLE